MIGKMPKYSIITSAYNQLEDLKKVKECLSKQTLKDFEWIVADDGSSDETISWCESNTVDYVTQEHDGYQLTKILNLAGSVAYGEYLVWVMADTRPHPDFLEKLDEVVAKNRVVNGVRVNVDKEGNIIGEDWRWFNVKHTGSNAIFINHKTPWVSMTLNTMCMPKAMWDEMGGIYPGYEGYGRMDWDMAMWAWFEGYELWWASHAKADHVVHNEREDTPENIKLYEERYEQFQAKGRYTRP